MANKKIVLVTGANTGLGYQIARALCSSETAYEVLIGGRSLAKAEQAVNDLKNDFSTMPSHVRAIQIDIEDDASIDSAYNTIQNDYGRLDFLVNNAGVQLDQQLMLGTMTVRQVWNETYNVNVTGTHIATSTFAPLLLKSNDPRLVFIASGTSSLSMSDNSVFPANNPAPKGWPKPHSPTHLPAYRSSKTGMNMLMREWYRMFKEDGVKVWGVSPGHLATSLGGNQEANKQMGAIDPSVGASLVKEVLEAARDGDVGTVVSRQGVQPW